MALAKGAIVEVLKRDAGLWWWGRIRNNSVIIDSEADLLQDDRHGWFPKDFVRIVERSSPMPHSAASVVVVNQAIGDSEAPATSSTTTTTVDLVGSDQNGGTGSSCHSASAGNSEMMRENVIRELLETEINYVKMLSSLCTG